MICEHPKPRYSNQIENGVLCFVAAGKRVVKDMGDERNEIADKRDELVKALEKRMRQKMTTKYIFTIRWRII